MPTADKDLVTMFMSFAGHCMGVIALALLALVTLPACEMGKLEVAAVRYYCSALLPRCCSVYYTLAKAVLSEHSATARAAAIAAPQLLTPSTIDARRTTPSSR